jgi:hypothetical protein
VAQPGTTVHVAPGTYAGGFQTTAAGTESSPIRYVSDIPWGAKIVPAAASARNMAWDNRGAYVAIEGFEVDGTVYGGGVRWRFGLYSAGTHTRIEHNHVHDLAKDPKAAHDGTGGSGIEGDSYYNGSDFSIVGNVVHDIGQRPATGGMVQGIYITGSGTIGNNLVYRIADTGIHLWHDANHVAVVNNTIFSNYTGVLVGGGDFVHTKGPTDYDYVANNIVYDNVRGVLEGGATGTHNTFTNNLVHGNGLGDWWLHGGSTHVNDVAADPRFARYRPTGNGDYHLAAGSPAINAGTATNAPTADLDGTPRQGTVPDIGAYEYAGKAEQPVPASSR